MNFLAQGEKIYNQFRISRKYPPVLKFFMVGILLLVVSAVLFFDMIELLGNIPFFPENEFLAFITIFPGIFLIIIGEIRIRKLGTYYLTDYRIVSTKGLFGTKMDSLSYSMIVNVRISQSFIERVFGLGDLEISTARGAQEIYMRGIPNPKKVENVIYRCIEGRTRTRKPEQYQPRSQRSYKTSQYRKYKR
jgi:uncharacterized membrane protein YdbT with pleckstrin-like domain